MQRVAIAPQQRQNDTIILSPQQQHYLYRVLRLKKGDRFIAMDGEGQSWIACLGEQQAEILQTLLVQNELPIAVTLMVALPKGNTFDEIVRCCTELGTAAFVPILSDRVLLNPSPQKLQRWRRIATEAAEQSERQWVPTVADPVPFTPETLLSDAPFSRRYICVARGNFPHLLSDLQQFKATFPSDAVGSGDIAIAIGPEGGWTAEEVKGAIAAGFQPVSLGKRILRAATAPIVALSWAAAIFEESI
ncbi:MAG: 16S rRNA (uracil(1498)-N(3))-methyltransferase [Cyanobacteriota bacterium]|nr:16S rRNA (uracil(1498)-N(3))-methyltransferase [Cyanobacteriota bacterium]